MWNIPFSLRKASRRFKNVSLFLRVLDSLKSEFLFLFFNCYNKNLWKISDSWTSWNSKLNFVAHIKIIQLHVSSFQNVYNIISKHFLQNAFFSFFFLIGNLDIDKQKKDLIFFSVKFKPFWLYFEIQLLLQTFVSYKHITFWYGFCIFLLNKIHISNIVLYYFYNFFPKRYLYVTNKFIYRY